MSKVIEFQTFDKDKVIIKQGDQAYSFYFIVSGSVLVEVTEEDQTALNLETKIVTELKEGSSFGELALIHECKRRATIVSKEKSEFLVIHKEDFEVSSNQCCHVISGHWERENKYIEICILLFNFIYKSCTDCDPCP